METRKRILAVASSGGHWLQLCRIKSAFEGCDTIYVTTQKSYREQVKPDEFYVVRDANRWDKIGLIIQAIQVIWIVIRVKPDIIITTGAAPGYFAIRIAKRMGARCVWLDSIANSSELSLSGCEAGKYADLWLTQWPHLAKDEGPKYGGAVI